MTRALTLPDEQGIVPGAGSGQNARSPSVQQRRENFPRHTSAVSGEVLGGRDATRVDYRDQMDANKETQTKLQNEIGKISQEIAELGSAHMPTKKISMFALMATVAIGGIVAVTASIFAAPLTCCIVVGALVGVLVGAATAITLHRRNCHLQEQGKLLERVRSANTGLSIASAALDDAYGNLNTMAETVDAQKATIEQQGKTIAQQRALVTKQTTKIGSLEEQNAELGRNLAAAQQAKEEAERQAQEIQNKAVELQSALENIKIKIAENEIEIERLRETNASQAAELQRQTDAMKSFVSQQQEMVSNLESTVRKNQESLDAMLEKVRTGSGKVNAQIEEIKAHVKKEFDDVTEIFTAATDKSNEVLAGWESKSMTVENLVEVQKKTNKAILTGIAKLGTMQAWIIKELTEVQRNIGEQQTEMERTIGDLRQQHAKALDDIGTLQHSCDDTKEKLELCQKQMDDTIARATELSKQGNKSVETDQLVLKAMGEAQGFSEQMAKLQQELANIGSNLCQARTYESDMKNTLEELRRKQIQIQANCEALNQQNQALRASNDELFGNAQRIGGNLGIIGEGIGKAATDIHDVAATVGDVTSRWNRLGAILGASLGGAGATAIGMGVVATGVAAAGGVVILPLACVLAKGYMEGVTGEYIASAREKVQGLMNSVSSTVSTSMSMISDFGSRIASIGSWITSIWH